MKRILIIGAGRSASTLIDYLQKQSREFGWKIVVAEKDTEVARSRVGNDVALIPFDVNDASVRNREIKKADLVISMLPARLHQLVAMACLEYSKNLMTPSYEQTKAESARTGNPK